MAESKRELSFENLFEQVKTQLNTIDNNLGSLECGKNRSSSQAYMNATFLNLDMGNYKKVISTLSAQINLTLILKTMVQYGDCSKAIKLFIKDKITPLGKSLKLYDKKRSESIELCASAINNLINEIDQKISKTNPSYQVSIEKLTEEFSSISRDMADEIFNDFEEIQKDTKSSLTTMKSNASNNNDSFKLCLIDDYDSSIKTP